MILFSLRILFTILLLSGLFFWIPTVRLRQIFLALMSVLFLFSQVGDATSCAVLLTFVGSGFLAAKILQNYASPLILRAYLVTLVVSFVVIKRYAFLAMIHPDLYLAETVSVVGLSYILFRQIHVVIDAYQGQLPQLTLWTYLNYQLNCFSLLAGPIQRYPQFAEDWQRVAPVAMDTHEILICYQRIFIGILKVVLISKRLLTVYNGCIASILSDTPHSSVKLVALMAIAFYCYPFYVYFNFSGYCDFVIGAGRLFGIRLPENFDFPFLSRNMIEYWTRWHITLGTWIRDYVFLPIYKPLATSWPKQSLLIATVCYFISLFVAGVWHGSTWNFVVFGALNGLGVAAAKLWEMMLIKAWGMKGFKSYLRKKIIHTIAVIVTFHFVCVTMLFFPPDLKRTMDAVTKTVTRIAGQRSPGGS